MLLPLGDADVHGVVLRRARERHLDAAVTMHHARRSPPFFNRIRTSTAAVVAAGKSGARNAVLPGHESRVAVAAAAAARGQVDAHAVVPPLLLLLLLWLLLLLLLLLLLS